MWYNLKGENKMEVVFYGVHGNSGMIGFSLSWEDPKFGFGQIEIDQSNVDGKILIDSESMSLNL
jgi:hypothetical protein